MMNTSLSALLFLCLAVVQVLGHGYLSEPPSRASMWRFGYETEEDYDDNGSNCGGFEYQFKRMGGRCGICGDRWDEEPHRKHEVGGVYAQGITVRHYVKGQIIMTRVNVTMNHLGYFEYRICPTNSPRLEATQECLNKYPLHQVNATEHRINIDSSTGEHYHLLQLPRNLTCSHCVLQWRYVAGNNHGVCEDGVGRLGCGPQEEFRACADVSITSDGKQLSEASGGAVAKAAEAAVRAAKDFLYIFSPDTIEEPTGKLPAPAESKLQLEHFSLKLRLVCKPVGIQNRITGMENWCNANCNNIPAHCPSTHCTCEEHQYDYGQ